MLGTISIRKIYVNYIFIIKLLHKNQIFNVTGSCFINYYTTVIFFTTGMELKEIIPY